MGVTVAGVFMLIKPKYTIFSTLSLPFPSYLTMSLLPASLQLSRRNLLGASPTDSLPHIVCTVK